MIFINYKTYPESTGVNAVGLQEAINKTATDFALPVISCPQTVDFRSVLSKAKQPVWLQHVDSVERGRATGWVIPEVAKEMGATGTLLNHSEHKLQFEILVKTVDLCKKIGLRTLILAGSPEECRKVAELQPDFIGYEPPELIASKDTSVARSEPEIIKKVVSALPHSKIIVGAGVKDREDVRVSLKLGAVGVILASAVVLADDPLSVLQDLAQGFDPLKRSL